MDMILQIFFLSLFTWFPKKKCSNVVYDQLLEIIFLSCKNSIFFWNYFSFLILHFQLIHLFSSDNYISFEIEISYFESTLFIERTWIIDHILSPPNVSKFWIIIFNLTWEAHLILDHYFQSSIQFVVFKESNHDYSRKVQLNEKLFLHAFLFFQ